jgi:hypothetical protein
MTKLHNNRFSKKTFYICMCKAQNPAVELPFFSSDTPTLKKWILLPHNAWSPTYKSLYLEHNADHPLQFSVKVWNAYNFTYTHTHNMPSWHDTAMSVIIFVENRHQTQALNMPFLGYLLRSKRLLHVLMHREW